AGTTSTRTSPRPGPRPGTPASSALEAEGRPARAVVIGGAPPPHRLDPSTPLMRMSDEALYAWVLEMGALDEADEEMRREFFAIYYEAIRADIEAYERYRTDRCLKTPLLVLGANDDHVCPEDHMHEWARYGETLDRAT